MITLKKSVKVGLLVVTLSMVAPFASTTANIREQLAGEGIQISEAENYAASQIAGAGNSRKNLCLDRLQPEEAAARQEYSRFRGSLPIGEKVLADDPNHPLGAALKNWEAVKSKMYAENGECQPLYNADYRQAIAAIVAARPTPTPTPTPTPSPTRPDTSTATNTPTPSPTRPDTSTATNTPTPSPTRTDTSTATNTPTPSPTRPDTSTATSTITAQALDELAKKVAAVEAKAAAAEAKVAAAEGKAAQDNKTSKSTSKTPEVQDDGEEEEPSANLIVSKESNGKYKFVISSNLPDDKLLISAIRKGFKSISYNVKTDDFGNASIITSRKLSGFALTLRYNGDSLDKVKVK